MNITLNTIDPVNALLKMEVVKADYADKVDKALKELRHKAVVPGFRVGKVPEGMIKKMYGKAILAEQINNLVTQHLEDYIRENNLNIIGEPLPNTTEQQEINFDTQEDFEFCFDLGFWPEITTKVTKRDKLPYYTIIVDDELIEQQIKNYCANFGSHISVDVADQEKDMLKGTLTELDEEGNPKNEGICVQEAVMMPSFMKNEVEKAKFTAATKDATIVFNPYDAYDGSEVELASFMKIKKEEVPAHTGNFSFHISEIIRYEEATVNKDLFDKVFGEGKVKTETEFREKIKEILAAQMAPESDYKFYLDIRKMLEKKSAKLQFPDAFLKRWLQDDKKHTSASVEKDYPAILADLRLHAIQEHIIRENNIKVEEQDLQNYGKQAVVAQFLQYGISNFSEEMIQNYVEGMLKNKETVKNMSDKIMETKLIEWFKAHVTLETKEVSREAFNKLFETEEVNKNENENNLTQTNDE
ncbi:MAG: trigger factor [Dysgonamonadaceae bacterium]|jgi:trigger factor|nr:trigger factor [Dysgonamonadaceae bacterium]